MAKRKVLIIDDEVDFAHLVKLNLEATGKYEVRVENEGARGLSAVLEFNPDIVFLDIVMPDMEGTAVASQIKADERIKDTPVVFLTATILKEEIPRNGKIGGNYFVSKPVSTEILTDLIEKILG